MEFGTDIKVRFHPEAEFELCAAREWYALQRSGFDAEFMRCIDSDKAEELRVTLIKAARNCDAKIGREDQYGKRYVLDFKMTTAKGQAKVRSTWIIRSHEDFARLASCYVLKRKERNPENE